MNVQVPTQFKKDISRNRLALGISESVYVSNALIHYHQLIALDTQFKDEMRLWESASEQDLEAFNKKNHL